MESLPTSKVLELDRVFLLGSSHERGALHVSPEQTFEDPFAVLTGEADIREPVILRQESGTVPRDFVGTTHACLFLVSTHVVSSLRSYKVSGWKTYPVEVVLKDGRSLKDFHGLVVTGVCGGIDNSRSTRVWRNPVSPLGERYEAWMGLYFDPSTWDGSDIFVPKSTGYIFVVEAVKQIFERENITNVRFVPITAVERMML